MRIINLLTFATLLVSACLNAQAPMANWHMIAPDLLARSYTSHGLRHTQFRALSANGSRAYAAILQVHHPALADHILSSLSTPSAHLRRVSSSDCTDLFSASGTSAGYTVSFYVRCPAAEGVIHGTVDIQDPPANLSGHYYESAGGTLAFYRAKFTPNPQKPFKGNSGSWSATEYWTTDGGASGGQCVTGITGEGDQPC